jgi:hypothetical protein
MARNNHNINSFVAGEVSKKFYGRTNSNAYNDSCEELSNMLVYPQGGIGKRPGTKYVTEIINADNSYPDKAAIIPFSGTDGTRWQIVMTNANPFATPATYSNVTAINMADESTQQVSGILGSYYEDGISSLYTSGISLDNISYAQDANNNLVLASKDWPPLIIIYDPQTGSFTLECFLAYPSDFDHDLYYLQKRWPLQAKSFNFTVLSSPTFGAPEITVNWATGATTLSTGTVDATWLGRTIMFTDGTNGTRQYVINGFSGPNILTYENINQVGGAPSGTFTYGGTSTTQFYRLGYWDRIAGWPRTVNFYDSRLVFGGNERFPEFLWFSEISNYDDFVAPDVLVSSDGFSTSLREGGRSNKVCWIQSGKTLVVGTDFHEFILQAADPTAEIGFDNIRRTLETPHGSAYTQSVKLENTTVFLNRNAATLRELVYNFNEDSFTATDLNIFNPDVYSRQQAKRLSSDYRYSSGRPILKQIVVEHQPDQRVWALDTNGFLACLTRERTQEVLAWSFHEIAGTALTGVGAAQPWDGKTLKPFIHSISVNQAPAYNEGFEREVDELWMVVERPWKFSSTAVRPRLYVERMYTPWDFPTIEERWEAGNSFDYEQAPIYMDGVYIHNDNDTPSGGVIGLPSSLSLGTVVTVVVNGKYFGDYTVSGINTIDINDKLNGETGFIAIIGYNYIGRVVPMIQEMPAQNGTSQGLPRRNHEIVINFFNSIGARFGLLTDENTTPNVSDFEDVTFPDSVNQDDPPLLFTGARRLKMPLGYDERPRVVIEAHLPYPCNISHIVTKGVVYE